MKKFSILSSIFYILIAAAVASAQQDVVKPPSPVVMVVEPASGAELPVGQDVMLQFLVESFVFVDFKNNSEPFPGNPNAGHGHLWVDDTAYDHETGKKLLSTDSVNLGVLEKGKHTVAIELMGNDHSAYDPPTRATVEFRVGGRGIFEGEGLSAAGVLGLLALLVLALAGFGVGFARREKLRTYLQKIMRKI